MCKYDAVGDISRRFSKLPHPHVSCAILVTLVFIVDVSAIPVYPEIVTSSVAVVVCSSKRYVHTVFCDRCYMLSTRKIFSILNNPEQQIGSTNIPTTARDHHETTINVQNTSLASRLM